MLLLANSYMQVLCTVCLLFFGGTDVSVHLSHCGLKNLRNKAGRMTRSHVPLPPTSSCWLRRCTTRGETLKTGWGFVPQRSNTCSSAIVSGSV